MNILQNSRELMNGVKKCWLYSDLIKIGLLYSITLSVQLSPWGISKRGNALLDWNLHSSTARHFSPR